MFPELSIHLSMSWFQKHWFYELCHNFKGATRSTQYKAPFTSIWVSTGLQKHQEIVMVQMDKCSLFIRWSIFTLNCLVWVSYTIWNLNICDAKSAGKRAVFAQFPFLVKTWSHVKQIGNIRAKCGLSGLTQPTFLDGQQKTTTLC